MGESIASALSASRRRSEHEPCRLGVGLVHRRAECAKRHGNGSSPIAGVERDASDVSLDVESNRLEHVEADRIENGAVRVPGWRAACGGGGPVLAPETRHEICLLLHSGDSSSDETGCVEEVAVVADAGDRIVCDVGDGSGPLAPEDVRLLAIATDSSKVAVRTRADVLQSREVEELADNVVVTPSTLGCAGEDGSADAREVALWGVFSESSETGAERSSVSAKVAVPAVIDIHAVQGRGRDGVLNDGAEVVDEKLSKVFKLLNGDLPVLELIGRATGRRAAAGPVRCSRGPNGAGGGVAHWSRVERGEELPGEKNDRLGKLGSRSVFVGVESEPDVTAAGRARVHEQVGDLELVEPQPKAACIVVSCFGGAVLGVEVEDEEAEAACIVSEVHRPRRRRALPCGRVGAGVEVQDRAGGVALGDSHASAR